jgi:magnesium chelatase family protein
MRPGEISCAHRGVLFLDELAEFHADVLESLRQPLEEGVIRVSRAAASVAYPARFLLVAATNPCPCGEGGPPGGCRCSDAARARYSRRLSGPLLDRLDLRVEVTRPDVGDLLGRGSGEPTSAVAERVAAARERAWTRGVACNSAIDAAHLDELVPLAPRAVDLLEVALRAGRLSARGLKGVRTVARTIADLQDGGAVVEVDHIAQALALRTSVLPVDAWAA